MKKDIKKLKYFARARYVKNGPWMLIRPHRHSLLRQDLITESVKQEPKKIWGIKKPGGLKEDKFGYWYKNLPSPDFMIKKIFTNQQWFKGKLKERKTVFRNCINYLENLEKGINKQPKISFYYQTLPEIQHNLIVMKIYIDFIKIPQDFLLLKFYSFLNSFMNSKEVFAFLISFFRIPLTERKRLKSLASFTNPIIYGSFFHNLVREKYTREISGFRKELPYDFSFPSPSYFSVNKLKFYQKYPLGFVSKKYQKILRKQLKEKREEFNLYCKFIPLLNILHEEMANLYYILFLNSNFVLDKISDDLIKRKLIKDKNELLNWKIKGIIKSYDFVGKSIKEKN
ncbi:MAG: hypothetical protein COY66_03150 [Candidatus Kerfeldbacteria bacterium CG_4_10_14_0_8_um_filter_42_10]|uniref:Uncharacterized protein n=1 Tax=Candidatus Kerfeldbacteria bacterium CG_4_10_14_0_8_um_filter_42_10 TaxID=2014248 RepID=A0A2M7RJQ1_9BACT|nr:MAG: hypothetical protein COY66_03150 [Candidatus Kerfeldbacteria bacterium CG_4_10_14_0_8_um_filter_42_10]